MADRTRGSEISIKTESVAHVVRLQATVLLTPAVGRLFGDLQNLADLGDLLALAKSNVRLAELLNNLIGRVSCLLYLQRILSGRRPDAMLS